MAFVGRAGSLGRAGAVHPSSTGWEGSLAGCCSGGEAREQCKSLPLPRFSCRSLICSARTVLIYALFNHVTKPGDKNQGWAGVRRLSPCLFGCLVILLSGVFPPLQLKSRLLLGNNCRRAKVATKPPPPLLHLRFSRKSCRYFSREAAG